MTDQVSHSCRCTCALLSSFQLFFVSFLSDNDFSLKCTCVQFTYRYQQSMDTQKQSYLPMLKLLLSSANRILRDKDDFGHFEMFLHLPEYLPFPLTLYGTARWPQKWRDYSTNLIYVLFVACWIFWARWWSSTVVRNILYSFILVTCVRFKGPFDLGLVG